MAILGSVFGLLALIIGLGLTVSAANAKTPLAIGQQEVKYDVYAGGIHALSAQLSIDINGEDSYDASLTAKTYGLLAKMAPWQGKFESRGWQGAAFKPELHQATTTWKEEKEIKKYTYNKDGSFGSYSIKDDKYDGSPKKVDDKLTQGTSDVLSATLNVMRAVANTSKCEGSEDIFDGKRRYKLIFNQKAAVKLESSRWNVYGGDAIECSVEVKPVAGKWREKPRGWMSIQEQGRELGTMPTVWFANVKKGEPAVPVKVRVKTSYGTLYMHMTKYEAAGKILSLKK